MVKVRVAGGVGGRMTSLYYIEYTLEAALPTPVTIPALM